MSTTAPVMLHPDLASDVADYAEARGVTLQEAVDRLLSIGLTRAAAVARYANSAKGRASVEREAEKRRQVQDDDASS